jgi:hypothetical protein
MNLKYKFFDFQHILIIVIYIISIPFAFAICLLSLIGELIYRIITARRSVKISNEEVLNPEK